MITQCIYVTNDHIMYIYDKKEKVPGAIKARNEDLTKPEQAFQAGATFALWSEGVNWSELCYGKEHITAEGF